ncbi:MAG TPA: hypothetical protein VGW10_00320 [Solirubrobacteraceae bacterium]|nr:hypothetical protein [Solirubrobacteraceae bacterium]
MGAAAPGEALAASETCTAPSTVAVDGYLRQTFLRLTAQRNPTNSRQTFVCFRAADGTAAVDRGGRILVTDAQVSPVLPRADSDGQACTTTAGNVFPGPRPLFGGQVGDPDEPPYAPVLIDAYLAPFQLWGCLQAGSIGARVLVNTSGISAPAVSVAQDAPGTPLPAATPGPLGYPSSSCQVAGGGRQANLSIHNAHIWAYRGNDPELTTQSLCLRVERAGQQPIGAKLTVDATGTPGITPVAQGSTVDTTPCSVTVVGVDSPIGVSLSRSPRGANPASICVTAGTTKQRITVGTAGSVDPPAVVLEKDPDSA